MNPVLVIIDQFPLTQPPRGLMRTIDTHSLVTSRLIIARRIGSTAASAFEDIIAEEVERKAVDVTYGFEICSLEVGLPAFTSRLTLVRRFGYRCSIAASAFGDLIEAVTVMYGVDLCGSEVGLMASSPWMYPGVAAQHVRPAPWNC